MKYDDIQIVTKNSIYKIGDKKNKIFYHGGVESNFDISKIDIYRLAEKQQDESKSYVGFYMYGEKDFVGAIKYAIDENKLKNTKNKGVVKIEMKDDVSIFSLPPLTISRLTKDQLQDLKKQGYDLIEGKMEERDEYVLLNKTKIINLKFMSLEECLNNLNKEELNEVKTYNQIKTNMI